MIDTKPQKRYRASKQEWQEIRDAFSEDRCWVCGERWTDLHHLLSRGAGRGDDVEANLAPVCRECHARIEAREPQARSLIRQALMPSNLAYLSYKLGENTEGWLSRHYALSLDLGLDLGVDLQTSSNFDYKPTLTSGVRTNVA